METTQQALTLTFERSNGVVVRSHCGRASLNRVGPYSHGTWAVSVDGDHVLTAWSLAEAKDAAQRVA